MFIDPVLLFATVASSTGWEEFVILVLSSVDRWQGNMNVMAISGMKNIRDIADFCDSYCTAILHHHQCMLIGGVNTAALSAYILYIYG